MNIDALQVIFGQTLTVAVIASCLNCLTSVDFVVVSSPLSLSSELHLDANRSKSGKKAGPVSFSSSSPLSSPSLTNHSPGSFVFTTSISFQLIAAHSDQTIINSNVIIGLKDSLNLANPIIHSEEEAFSLTTCGTFGEARGEQREERTGELRRGEWLDDHVRPHLLTYLFFCSPSHLICVYILNNWWRRDCTCYVLWQLYLFSFVFCFLFFVFCFLFCFVLFCFVLFCFVLFCFVLFCFVLFCFVLFCFVFVFVLFLFFCVLSQRKYSNSQL